MSKPSVVKHLAYFVDDRGYSIFNVFPEQVSFNKGGQYNISHLDKGSVKAFHLHRRQSDYVTCIKGRVKLVTCAEDFSDVDEFYLSELTPQVVRIPPGYWHGYKALDKDTIILYHCTREYDPLDPDEERAEWDSIGTEVWETRFK